MAGRIALVATGRSPLPTGTTLLEADLAEDVDVRAVDRALALHDVEIQVLAPARPHPQPEQAPETTVAPVPLALPEKPDDMGHEPETAPAGKPDPPAEPEADPLAAKSDDEVRRELEAAAAFDEEVKALVDANTRDELIEIAESEEVTFSLRANMTQIATDIEEKRQALRSFSGEGRAD